MSRKTKITISAILIVGAIAFCGWYFSPFRTRSYDVTDELDPSFVNHDLVCSRPIIICKDYTGTYAVIGSHNSGYPESMKEYKQNPNTYVSKGIIDAIPPGTLFQITSVTQYGDQINGLIPHLTIEFTSGEKKGESYSIGVHDIFASDFLGPPKVEGLQEWIKFADEKKNAKEKKK